MKVVKCALKTVLDPLYMGRKSRKAIHMLKTGPVHLLLLQLILSFSGIALSSQVLTLLSLDFFGCFC
jgi:hypothetical protein